MHSIEEYKIESLGQGHYRIFKGKKIYELDSKRGYCSCPGFIYRGHCKHWKIVAAAIGVI